ncbi:MAG: hypothetical protein E4G98_03930 [Promethearchaeota archaeon]|nr:MAG: hypothetical protein E4G98_03930 [Candidatus Lokiarchaeota archaeon]
MKPFLEISIISYSDPNLYLDAFFQRAKENLLDYGPIPPERIEITDVPSIYLEYQSLEDFEALYEKDFRVYTFLLDQILQSPNSETILNQNLQKLSADSLTNTNSNKSVDDENYLVLRYKSNYLDPMKKNYNLVHRMNRFLGVQIINEELQDGFIRFVKTKADYESMFVGNDEVEKWIQFFEVLQLDITHPTIVKFLEIIKSYLN